MTSLLLSSLAGVLTTLSPCVLPILPVILLGALQQHRFGPLALAGGLVVAFTTFGALLAALGLAFNIDSDTIRQVSAWVILAFGVILLSASLQVRFATVSAPLANPFNSLLERSKPTGLGGLFALGMLLGAVWTPCSGPTLGAAIGLAANSETALNAAVIMAFFSLGATLPLLALAYGSRAQLMKRRQTMARLAHYSKPILGAVLVLLAIMILSGIDKALETLFVEHSPSWLNDLTTRF